MIFLSKLVQSFLSNKSVYFTECSGNRIAINFCDVHRINSVYKEYCKYSVYCCENLNDVQSKYVSGWGVTTEKYVSITDYLSIMGTSML